MNRPVFRRSMGILILLAIILSIIPACFAEESEIAGKTLDGLIGAYMQQHGLNEENFAVSYYNTVTGETFEKNENKLMIAASTYKLPLNLYYYRMEKNGEIAPDALIPEAGGTLDILHERSIVHSDNDVSEGMMYHLGNYRTYKDCMLELLGMTSEDVDPMFYTNNYFSTHMMLLALQYLYENAETYPEMLEYMKQAQPQNGYFLQKVTEIPVAHKYGSYEGAENDTGIFYTEQPFLLAVYTYCVNGESICADLARLVTDYNVYYAEKDAQAALLEQEQAERQALEEAEKAEKEAAEIEPEAEKEIEIIAEQPLGEPEEIAPEEPYAPLRNVTWWMIAIALGICLCGGWILHRLTSAPGKFEKRMKKYDKTPK